MVQLIYVVQKKVGEIYSPETSITIAGKFRTMNDTVYMSDIKKWGTFPSSHVMFSGGASISILAGNGC